MEDKGLNRVGNGMEGKIEEKIWRGIMNIKGLLKKPYGSLLL